jgi:hypothetical protein
MPVTGIKAERPAGVNVDAIGRPASAGAAIPITIPSRFQSSTRRLMPGALWALWYQIDFFRVFRRRLARSLKRGYLACGATRASSIAPARAPKLLRAY